MVIKGNASNDSDNEQIYSQIGNEKSIELGQISSRGVSPCSTIRQ